MTNSLNSPVSHVVKITSEIPVYLEIEDRFPIGKTAQKLKNHFGIMGSQIFHVVEITFQIFVNLEF